MKLGRWELPGRKRVARQRAVAASLLAAALFAVGVVSPPPANAYDHLCGKWVGSDPRISYRYYDVTDTYRNAFGSGQAAWDAPDRIPGYHAIDSDNGDPMIEVRDYAYSWDDWARATAQGCTWGWWDYNEVKIQFNSRTMSGLSSREKKIVAIHEIGHAYGLAHEYYTCSNPGPTIMRQGTGKFGCDGDGPWYDDAEGVRAKY